MREGITDCLVKESNLETHKPTWGPRDWKTSHVQTGFFSRNPSWWCFSALALAPCYCTHFESSESPAPVDPFGCQKTMMQQENL